MIDKLQLTEKLLSQLNMPTDTKTVNKYFRLWWANTRKHHNNSLRLTEPGFEAFTQNLDIARYEIQIPEEVEWTSQLILRMDKFLESPYFIQKSSIVVFREKTAVELVLFGGDLQKYGNAKNKSKKSIDNLP